LVNQEPKTDIPIGLDIDMQVFRRCKPLWLLWRSTGSFDGNGNFFPSISFLEARSLPKEEIDLFYELDSLLAIRQKQMRDKKS